VPHITSAKVISKKMLALTEAAQNGAELKRIEANKKLEREMEAAEVEELQRQKEAAAVNQALHDAANVLQDFVVRATHNKKTQRNLDELRRAIMGHSLRDTLEKSACIMIQKTFRAFSVRNYFATVRVEVVDEEAQAEALLAIEEKKDDTPSKAGGEGGEDGEDGIKPPPPPESQVKKFKKTGFTTIDYPSVMHEGRVRPIQACLDATAARVKVDFMNVRQYRRFEQIDLMEVLKKDIATKSYGRGRARERSERKQFWQTQRSAACANISCLFCLFVAWRAQRCCCAFAAAPPPLPRSTLAHPSSCSLRSPRYEEVAWCNREMEKLEIELEKLQKKLSAIEDEEEAQRQKMSIMDVKGDVYMEESIKMKVIGARRSHNMILQENIRGSLRWLSSHLRQTVRTDVQSRVQSGFVAKHLQWIDVETKVMKRLLTFCQVRHKKEKEEEAKLEAEGGNPDENM
jgi:hypothetical protein